MSSALGPFNAIVGSNTIAVKAYIFSLLSKDSHLSDSKASESEGESSEGEVVTYVLFIHQPVAGNNDGNSSSNITAITLYQLVIDGDDSLKMHPNRRLFCLSRITPLECLLELLPAENSSITLNQRRNKQNVLLLYVDFPENTLLTKVKNLPLEDDAALKCLDPCQSYSDRIRFGSKFDADIFQRSLEFHAESLSSKAASSEDNSMATDTENDDYKKPAARPNNRGRKRSSVVVSLRRTSSMESNPAYEVIGMRAPKPSASKRRKSSKTDASMEPVEPSDFYFILPKDFVNLTDYYILLYSQVNRGAMCEADSNMANRRHAASSDTGLGFLGLRCRHCGGKEKGSYFPSSCKNLQACRPTIHNHLMKCASCPDIIRHSLKVTKTRHKTDMISKQAGAQSAFYIQFWDRIQGQSFDGEAHSGAVIERLNAIKEQCSPTTNTATRQPEPEKAAETNRDRVIPTIVSYDSSYDSNDCLVSQALIDDQDTSASGNNSNTSSITNCDVVTEEDFEQALELLRRPPTPNSRIDLNNPPEVNITPVPVQNIRAPTAIRISESGEYYLQDGEFIIPDHYYTLQHEVMSTEIKVSTPKKKSPTKKTLSDDDSKTRKFTRDDEVLLVRGMMAHGKKWKTIWDAEPLLQHIKHSALKDRARSKRFQEISARAKEDPSLLDDPERLCGSEDQQVYIEDGMKSPFDTAGMPISELSDNDGDNEKNHYMPSSPVRTRENIDVPIEALVDRSPFQNKKQEVTSSGINAYYAKKN